MKTRLFVPAFLIAGAFALIASAEDAAAAPLAPSVGKTAVAFGPRVHVGVGVTVPVGHRHVVRRRPVYREVVEYVGGYYETRTEEVVVPGRRIGYDRFGHPIYSGDRIELREVKVWIPRRRIVRQVRVRRGHAYRHGYRHAHVHAQPRGYVTVGGSVRVR